jgi:hypothetical protein
MMAETIHQRVFEKIEREWRSSNGDRSRYAPKEPPVRRSQYTDLLFTTAIIFVLAAGSFMPEFGYFSSKTHG